MKQIKQHWLTIIIVLIGCITTYGGLALHFGAWKGATEARLDTVERAQTIVKEELRVERGETNKKLERLENIMLKVHEDIGELKGKVK